MNRKYAFKLLGLVGVSCLALTACGQAQDDKTIAYEKNDASYSYDLFPKVKEASYEKENSFKLTDNINIVKSSFDNVTMKRLQSLIKESGYNYTVSDSINTSSTNITLAVDKAIDAEDAKIDNYTLSLDKGLIKIVGEDENSLFYGVNTLGLMLEEIKENDDNVSGVAINDYASAKNRGVIEGFYGVPWNLNDRISVFEFGSKYKMNSYTFAPKDDKYHSTMWRTLYPSAELAEMRKLVKAATDNKIEFTWAIHPLMHDSLEFGDTYEVDLGVIQNKFKQLYEIGVRRFAVSADDIAVPGTADEAFFATLGKNHAKLLNDLEKFGETLEEAVSFEIVPTTYFKNAKHSKVYLEALGKDLSKNVDVYYTGDEIMGTVNEKAVGYFKETAGRSPLFWLNWPVNDYYDTQLFMGEATCLSNDVTELQGVLANPMSQTEASKVGIFQVLDYAWNIKGFTSSESYRASFDAIDKEYGLELYTFASNIATYPVGAFWVTPITNRESQRFDGILEPVLEMTKDPAKFLAMKRSDMRLMIDPIYAELNNVIKAIDTYREAGNNRELVAEITPWMNSLRDLMIAGVRYMDIINSFIREGEKLPSLAATNTRLENAKNAVKLSESTYMVSVIDTWGSLYYASTGDLVLKPFFAELHKNIANIAATSLK